MGLKSGSRDAGLDDEDDSTEKTEDQQAAQDAEPTDESSGSTETSRADESETDTSESASDRPSMDAIPYKLRRDKVNEGREQVPYFLREEVIDSEDDLQQALEEQLGEKVYKSDYREAAMVVAQRNPALVAEVLRQWGYDLDA